MPLLAKQVSKIVGLTGASFDLSQACRRVSLIRYLVRARNGLNPIQKIFIFLEILSEHGN